MVVEPGDTLMLAPEPAGVPPQLPVNQFQFPAPVPNVPVTLTVEEPPGQIAVGLDVTLDMDESVFTVIVTDAQVV